MRVKNTKTGSEIDVDSMHYSTVLVHQGWEALKSTENLVESMAEKEESVAKATETVNKKRKYTRKVDNGET